MSKAGDDCACEPFGGDFLKSGYSHSCPQHLSARGQVCEDTPLSGHSNLIDYQVTLMVLIIQTLFLFAFAYY